MARDASREKWCLSAPVAPFSSERGKCIGSFANFSILECDAPVQKKEIRLTGLRCVPEVTDARL
jgi:hypothetical protein